MGLEHLPKIDEMMRRMTRWPLRVVVVVVVVLCYEAMI